MALEKKKLFVGGLSWETTSDSLKAYFEQFGDVTEASVMVDNGTKKPRGFGFVTFAEEETAFRTLEHAGKHVVDGKECEVKAATVKGASTAGDKTNAGKIFVGGIAPGTSPEEVKELFSTYGVVTDVDLKVDKGTNIMRGFGFVTFESAQVANEVIRLHYLTLNGKKVEAKPAEPREPRRPGHSQGQYSHQQMHQQQHQQQQQQQQYMGYPQQHQSYGGGGSYYSQTYPYGTGNYSGYSQTTPSYSYGASNQPGVAPSQSSYPTTTPPTHSAAAAARGSYASAPPVYQDQYSSNSYSYQTTGAYKGQGASNYNTSGYDYSS